MISTLSKLKLFPILLAAIFAVTSSPYIGALAEPPKGYDRLLQYEQDQQGLREHFSARADGQLPQVGNTQHPLDQFHILRQVVIDHRWEDVDQAIDKAQTEHRAELLEFRLEQIKNATHLSQAEKKELSDNVKISFEETPEVLEDLVDTDIKPRKYYGLDLTFDIRDSNRISVQQLKEKDFQGSLTSRFHSDNKAFNARLSGEENYQIFILSKKGETVSEFEIPIKNAVLWGNYLVFLEANSYDASSKTMPVRFIDLEYFRGAIGNAPLPVFTLPVHADQAADHLSVVRGELSIGKTVATKEYVDLVSNAQKALYNIQVSLVDPKTLEANESLIRELAYYVDQMVTLGGEAVRGQMKAVSGGEEKLKELVAQSQKILGTQTKTGPAEAYKEVVKALEEAPIESGQEGQKKSVAAVASYKNDKNFQDGLTKTNQSVQISRKLLTRLNLLVARLMHPQPNGSAKILQALVITAEGGFTFNWEKLKEGASSIKNHPYLRYLAYGSGATGAAFLSQLLPEQYVVNLSDILAMGSASLEHIHGYFKQTSYGMNYLTLAKEAAVNTAQSITGVWDAYVGVDKTPRLLVGVGTLVSFIGAMFGTLHLTANTLDTFKNMRTHWAKAREEGLGRMKAFLKAFTRYQQDKTNKFNIAAAKAEQEHSGGEGVLTDTQLKDLEYHIEKIQEANSNSVISKTWSGIKALVGWPVTASKKISRSLIFWRQAVEEADDYVHSGEASSESALRLTSDIKKNTRHFSRIETFPKALKQFFFSYPSLLSTYKFVGRIWNYGFIGRSFVLRPKLWYMMATYPKFFRTTVSAGLGEAQVPTQFNGGLRRTWQTGRFWANKQVKGTYFDSDTEALNLIKSWERKILPIEKEVTNLALEKALGALIHYVDDPKKLEGIFESGQLPKMGLTNEQIRAGVSPSTGISNLVDKKVKKILNKKERTYFRAYFSKIFEDTMSEYLRQVALDNGMKPDEIKNLSPKELKLATLKHSESFSLEHLPSDAAQDASIRAYAEKIMDQLESKGKVKSWAQHVASAVSSLLTRMSVNYRSETMAAVNPSGPQLTRFLTFEAKVGKFSAALRAMRSELAGLLVNVPMNLLTRLVMFAGVTEGVLVPLSEQFMGPDSFFYLSRYLFYTGFLYGTFISFMADFWMKLQVDARIDDVGNFDRMPSVGDRQKPHWRYYFKSLKNPENKWWQNHFHLIKLVTANIPAAFVTYLVGYMAFLGRFDIGIFLAGYAMYYLTPLSGFTYKLEQGFELSSSWVKGQIPRDLLASPEAATFVNKEIQKRKMKFNFFFQIYEIVIGAILTKFELMNTDEFGKRSFLRMMFGGYTPTELMANGLRNLGDLGAGIPGFQKAMESCESFFTNNYTDWEKAIPTEEYYGK